MTAAEAREQLEATIWRERGGSRKTGAGAAERNADVDAILAAADNYAMALAEETVDIVMGPRRLAEAAAEAFERKGNANGT